MNRHLAGASSRHATGVTGAVPVAIGSSTLLAVTRAKAQGLGPALAASHAGSTWDWLPGGLPASSAVLQSQRGLIAPPVASGLPATHATTVLWMYALGFTCLVAIVWLAVRKRRRG